METPQTEFSIIVDTDPARLDRDAIFEFLSQSYWAKGITREIVERSIQNSLCFGAYAWDKQVGFARVVTDFATFAYLADVFVLESFRGRGIGRKMLAAVLAHPQLQGLRRWLLATRDAHGIYSQFGFVPLKAPGRFMEIHRPYQD
ncbi:MAG: GNAT family N-acetyltransferase [Terriglobia bacterium]